MKIASLVFLLFVAADLCPLSGQTTMQPVPPDNSFGVASEFRRQLVNFPFIELPDSGDTTNLIIVRNVEYVSHDQRALLVDVFHPKPATESQKFPAIVILHGGGWHSGNRQIEHPLALALARKGFAAVCVEYRLSGEALYPAAIIDVLSAIAWVNLNPYGFPFSPGQTVVLGASAGGQMASLVAAINGSSNVFEVNEKIFENSRVSAAVNIDGILAFIHPESGEGADRPGRPSAATRWFGNTATENPQVRHQASALWHVNSNSAPTLFINSSIPRFRAGRDDYIKKAESFGIDNHAIEFENSMHTFWLFNPWFDKLVEQIDRFLSETLK